MKPISIVEAESSAWSECAFIDYMCEVDQLLYEQYGITADDLDAVAAAQEAGETPEEHVAWMVERYELCPLPCVATRGGMVC